MRKHNIIDIYFNEQGVKENKKSINVVFPQSNHQTFLYANFKSSEPKNPMGISIETYSGEVLPERPMKYVGKFYNDGEYHRYEFTIGEEITKTFRADRDTFIKLMFYERQNEEFLGFFDTFGDLDGEIPEEYSLVYVFDESKMYQYINNEWVEADDEYETFNIVWGSSVIKIPVARGLRIERKKVNTDMTQIILGLIADLQQEVEKLKEENEGG